MNILEAYSIESPSGKVDECAKFVIDDVTNAFVLSNIASVGQEYTFSFWIKSDTNTTIVVANNTFVVTNKWTKHILTFVASKKDISILFNANGTYFIYHPQLEIGNKATDWTPAPEDVDDKIDTSINDNNTQLTIIRNMVSDLAIEADAITASVGDMKTSIDSVTGQLQSAQEELATLKLSSDNLDLQFKNIVNDGVSKVVTETGFIFDREGMTIDSTDSPTKTQVTPDGMTVYKKDAAGTQEEVLEATSEGVDATNLHAKTYLIIGGRSRFENYGSDRTGCFWIGG